ncbi:sulfatase [Agaribacterium sp. ZY112]|uniref:sulfatase family protein n=1 Tax=Agaribacterium sp. ZY112 TaxID=3233574 RepID=UPI003524581B
MKRLTKLRLFTASVLLCISGFVLAKDERPNIVVILADDLGYNDVGFTGKTEIQTPSIDQLAEDGVIFENGFVTHPYCGPSRAGLLTGRYQQRFGMENNISYTPYDPHMGLPLTEMTFAKRLQETGYHTSVFGKWHLGGAPHFQPNQRGFDYFYGFLDGGHQYFPHETTVGGTGYLLPIMRNSQVAEFDEYLTTALSRDAAKYIDRQSKKDHPFFMYVSYNAPHAPLQAPQNYIDQYKHIKDEKRRVYAAMVDAMDDGIQMLIDSLKKNGEFDNTLIFFLSDNGGLYPYSWWPDYTWADNSPYRYGKVALTEGGVHVPFIAHWPNKIKKGQRFDGLVSALDIAATSLALAGADVKDAKLDGVDLTPYVSEGKKGSPHEALFWRLEEAENLWAVRTIDAKYIRQPLPDVGHAYYDLEKDPYESTNLIGQYPKKQAKLAALWNEWNKDNIRNIQLQNMAYLERRKAFFDELYKESVEASEAKPPMIIK